MPTVKTGTVLEVWLGFLKPSTAAMYRAHLRDFSEFLNMNSAEAEKYLVNLKAGEGNLLALKYRADLTNLKLAPATINSRMSAFRSYLKQLRKCGLITWTVEVENLKVIPYKDTRGPTLQEVAALFTAVDNPRDMAILRLAHTMGLRRGEIVGLDLSDFDPQGRKLAVLGKGYYEKSLLTMPDKIIRVIHDWLELRGRWDVPLFLNPEGRRISSKFVYRTAKKWGREIGIDLTPHALRHSGATTLDELTNGNTTKLCHWGRWASRETAQKYIDNHLDQYGELAQMLADVV